LLNGESFVVFSQVEASPTTFIFRSNNISIRAERSSVKESAIKTLIIHLSYTKHSPAASTGWGVSFSATWGRCTKKSFVYSGINKDLVTSNLLGSI
jgi:hypothetical protein